MKQTRDNLYQSQINNIITGTKNWSSKNAKFLPEKDGEMITLTLGQLKIDGFIKEDIKDPRTKKMFPNDMEIIITRIINNYEYEIIEGSGGINDDIIDENSPTIILNGMAHETVEINSEYIDKGVIARDPNGNIISNVNVEISLNDKTVSEVDTSKFNQYKITYTAFYNDVKASVIRTVTIRDTIPPILSIPGNISIYNEEIPDFDFMKGVKASDNSLEEITIKLSGNITTVPGQYLITYTAEDSSGNKTEKSRYITVLGSMYPEITILGSNPASIFVEQAYMDAGATAKDAVDKDITHKIITTGTVNLNVPGNYNITYRVTNSKGKEMSVIRVVKVIDNVPPVVTFSPNGNSTYAKSHSSKVTVTDKHSSVNTSSLKYLWTTSTSTPSEGSFSSTFANNGTISTPSGVTGSYYLWILAKDSVGNTKIQRSNVFRLDNTPPTCVSSGGSTKWTKDNITITGTCSDTGGSGCSSSTVTKTYSSNTNTTTASPGTVKDNAGNTTTCPANRTVKIDKTPPTCTSSGGNTKWTKGNITITGTCKDTGGSGCVGNVSKTYSSNTNTTTASPGTVKDNAGNTTTCPANRTVKIDKTPPSISRTAPSSGWHRANVNVSFSASDSLSKIKEIIYRDCSTCTIYTKGNNNSPMTFTSNRNRTTVQIGARDNAGNTTWSSTFTLRIDKTNPTVKKPNCEYSVATGSVRTLYISSAGSDSGGSGVSHICMTWSGIKKCTASGSGSTSLSITSSKVPSSPSVIDLLEVFDKAGNKASKTKQTCATFVTR